MLLNVHKGIFSPALISSQQLQAIVDWTMGQHSHSPLVEDTMLYYTLASEVLIKHFVIALVPFQSAEDFHLYSLIPFPVLMNNTPVIWNDV